MTNNNNEDEDRNRYIRELLADARRTLARQPAPYVPRDVPARFMPGVEPESSEPDEPFWPKLLDTMPSPAPAPSPTLNWGDLVERRIDQERAYMVEYVTELLSEVVAAERELHAETIASVREKYEKAIADLRASHERDLLELRWAVNEATIAVSRLTAFERDSKAVLSLAGMEVRSGPQ